MANRLAGSSSPYLQQHADNPVDWWEWCPEAFAEARARDVPVLLSVGYAACHWCHVMAHESFEDAGVAEVLNRDFVAVKVDREERPDVDAVYMGATQAMTGQGGWPMTVFATPDGQPFFAGTYFPRANFLRLLDAVGRAWREQRDEVLRQSGAVVTALAGMNRPAEGAGALSAEVTAAAVRALSGQFDEARAGFGGAPKFPPHLVLLFLLRHHQRTGDALALEMAAATCEAMARGGIYDQVGGGFARYSVDAMWAVPHFEKMLYDNALLLRGYTLLARLTGDAAAWRVAAETAGFLLDDLATPEGGFASALDADTDGVEGATYVWTPAQLVDALGADDGAFAADLLGVTSAGNFEHGTSVPALRRDVDAADAAVRQRWQRVRERLREVRAARPQPARDDKVVAAWNGLAVTALTEFAWAVAAAGSAVADLAAPAQRALRAAVRAGDLLAATHLVEGRLRRVSRDGNVGAAAGVLDDHGCVAEAFCALHQATADGVWLERARLLLDTALERFRAPDGGFHDTADDAERLVTRPADPTDNATPSGLSAAAAALVTFTALTGETRYREAAATALATVGGLAAGHPRFAGYALATAEAVLSGPYEVAVVTAAGTEGGPSAPELTRTAWRLAPPGAVVVTGPPDLPGVPLLAGRQAIGGAATAYLCRGFVCDRPVTSPADLATRLDDTRTSSR
jgi:uncharacterized protein YyaL (SSP411 family)